MIIKKIELYNFRSASKIEFDFDDRLNLFVGVNGSGKSTVLDALAISLSWLLKRIERDDEIEGRGQTIPDSSLRNGEEHGYLDIKATVYDESFRWLIAKTAVGVTSERTSKTKGVEQLARLIRDSHKETIIWPVIAYYPVNRIVRSERLRDPDRDIYAELDVYENALVGKTNYQGFFEWFRQQEDIYNEEEMSRNKWMKRNRRDIESRTTRLVEIFKDSFLNEIGSDEIKYKYLQDLKISIQRLDTCFSIGGNKDFQSYQTSMNVLDQLNQSFYRLQLETGYYTPYSSYFFDAGYLLHLLNCSRDESGSALVHSYRAYAQIMRQIFNDLKKTISSEHSSDNKNRYVYETLIFAHWLGLWWLNAKQMQQLLIGLQKILHNIGSTNNRLDAMAKECVALVKQVVTLHMQRKESNLLNQGKELEVVTEAIQYFLPEFTNLRVKRTPRPHMLIDKDGKTFNLDQLSDGEKNLIVMVGDIARRLAMGNPRLENPLEGEGVILIDEIDLHLHPKWQRLVIPQLSKVFPNVQWFISTHSPQVISHVKPENVFLLDQIDGELTYTKPDESYGMSVDRVVELLMDDEARPIEVQELIDKTFELIERDRFEEAKSIIAKLKDDMQTDPELLRAETIIRVEEMKR